MFVFNNCIVWLLHLVIYFVLPFANAWFSLAFCFSIEILSTELALTLSLSANFVLVKNTCRTLRSLQVRSDGTLVLEFCLTVSIIDINLLYYIQRKIFSRQSIFLYSPCPNLEGIEDALSYKFRRLTIGQNCAVCTDKVARA